MIKLDGIILIITTLVLLYSLFDCGRTEQEQVRKLPKWAWLLVIIIVPFGGFFWLGFGRPKAAGNGGGRSKKPRIIPPDDDPDFLRKL